MDDFVNLRVVLETEAVVEFGVCKMLIREETGFLFVVAGKDQHCYPKGRWIEVHGEPKIR